MFFEVGYDGSEMLDFAEEAFDQIAQAIAPCTEGGESDASGHRLDVGPGAVLGQRPAQSIAVIGAVGQEALQLVKVGEGAEFLLEQGTFGEDVAT